jgi:predicted phage-related endonuclease
MAEDRIEELKQSPSKADLTEYAGHFEIWKMLDSKAKELAKEAEAIKDILKAAMGNADVGLIDGVPVVTFKEHKQSRIVPDWLRQRYPQIAEEVTDRQPQRQFKRVE